VAPARGALRTAARRRYERWRARRRAPPPGPLVAIPGRSCWQRAPARRVAFLIDAADYFAALASALLCAAAERAPRLRIRVLDWDFSWLMTFGRELLPWIQLDWRTPERVEFRLDGRHPVGSCHHQKIVVVDDAVAFVGGIDLTTRRWDTSEHAAEHPARRTPSGRPYDPVHDVQVAVDGEAAAALGGLARERWRRATGRRVRHVRRERLAADPWPPGLVPDLERVDVAIARTEPAYAGRREVREIERLYLDAIAAARRSIYVENQFLTSDAVAEALCARLHAPDGPDVVIVGPERCSAWLEGATMGVLRSRIARRLRDADRHGRLRLVCPRLAGGASPNVHSKLIVVDEGYVQIGSANLSNRSMGLDTECDVAIEAAGEPSTERGIEALRERLLAEHLDVARERVRDALRATRGRLSPALDALAGRARTLVPLDAELPPWLDRIAPEIPVADPERPFGWARVVESWTPDAARDPVRRPLLLMLPVLIVLGLLASC
jgi:phosphatidylserine/phosphatidylglycerophosphate/cardiolipin synthase-like enzyme